MPGGIAGKAGNSVAARPGGQEIEFGAFIALSLHHSGQPAMISVSCALSMFSNISGFYPPDASSSPQI